MPSYVRFYSSSLDHGRTYILNHKNTLPDNSPLGNILTKSSPDRNAQNNIKSSPLLHRGHSIQRAGLQLLFQHFLAPLIVIIPISTGHELHQ